MTNVTPTPAQKLRLLRLRHSLTEATRQLEDALLELEISDDFANDTLKAATVTKRALGDVVSSLQAFDEPESTVVK